MGLLDRYKETPTPSSTLLTQQEAMDAFDLFLEGKTAGEIKLMLCLSNTAKVKTLEKRLVDIIDMMERIVKREARLVREEGHNETNEETGEQTWVVDIEEVICPVPSTQTKLNERALELVSNDYDVTEPLFATDDVMELVTGLNYVIDKVIKYSESDGSGTFDSWKSKVIGG